MQNMLAKKTNRIVGIGLKFLMVIFISLIMFGSFAIQAHCSMDQAREDEVQKKLDKILSSKEFSTPPEGETVIEKISETIRKIIDKIKELLNDVSLPEANLPMNPPKGTSTLAVLVFKGLCVLVLVAVIVILIYFIAKNIKLNRKLKEKEDEELLLQLKDPNTVEQQALDFYSKGDFTQALRYLYLALLLNLNSVNIIKIDKSKTNKQYMSEIHKSTLTSISKIEDFTRDFNRCWYGGRSIGKEGYDSWQKEYTSILREVQ